MTSTFSTNLNLQYQGVGDNANTWGTVLNTNVFANIDTALGGYFTTSVAGSSDYTLSQANALNLRHTPTGILTGNISYVFPANAGRIVMVHNNTTGNFTLTVKQSGGTGVIVPQGSVAIVWLNPTTTTASLVVPVTTLISIASATACDIGITKSQNVSITGTTTITGLGSSASIINPLYFVTFAGALTLTYNATSLILPTAANITTATNDAAIFQYLGSGNWQCLVYQKANGQALAGTTGAVTTTGSPANGNLTKFSAATTITNADLTGAVTTSGGLATSLGSFTSAQLATALTDETGSGNAVFATSPTLVMPILGTPASGNLSNCTAYPIASVANLGTGIATFLATPSSANLATALTDETGTGANVFANTPTLIAPLLGTPTSGVLTNCTGTASGLTSGNVTTNANLTGAITSVGNAASLGSFTSANLATALTDETGTGANVFAGSPTFTGTPTLPTGTIATTQSAGDNSTNIATTAYVTTAIVGIAKIGQTAAQAMPASGGLVTVAHGLSSTPKQVIANYKCVSTEGGWAANDIVSSTMGGPYDNNFPASNPHWTGSVTYADATNVYCRIGDNVFDLPRKDTGARFSITTAKWNVILTYFY